MPGAAAEQRVRAVLDAVVEIGAGLELPVVLQRIVTSACTLTGARYGALDVRDAHGRIAEFYSHGLTDAEHAALGEHPSGLGLPGVILSDPAPMRLSNLAFHPRFVGFPADHPLMRTFLGVPIRAGEVIFGNLHVAEKQPDDAGRTGGAAPALFTAEDEESVLALAAAAGAAVDNARLYRSARRRQTWWEAASQAVYAVIDAEGDPAAPDRGLQRVAEITRRAAEADLVAVLLPAAAPAGDELVVVAAAGERAADALGRQLPRSVDDAWVDGAPWLPDDVGSGAAHGPQLVLPLSVGHQSHGAIGLLWAASPGTPAARPPEAEDVVLMRTYAQRVALALEADRAAGDRAALALLQDRDRIARDLHDHVIQRLFAVGLSLQAAGNVARVPEVARRLARAVDDLDDTIKDVRRTIFELHGTAVRSPLRDELEDVVAACRGDLGMDPRLVVEGPILAVPEDLGADLVAVVREGLTNVAKHADASRVDVLLHIGRSIDVQITDDGVGPPGGWSGDDVGRRSGLANLDARARARGGSFEVAVRPGGGTALHWCVPRR